MLVHDACADEDVAGLAEEELLAPFVPYLAPPHVLAERYLCLEIELTSFGPAAYPIETGVADVASGETKAWLIRPPPSWNNEDEWQRTRYHTNGIDRGRLEAEGIPIEQVASELAGVLAGAVVISENIDAHERWLRSLYRVAGIRQPTFSWVDNREFALDVAGRNYPWPESAVAIAAAVAESKFPNRHRAGSGARMHAEMIRFLMGIV